MLSDILVAVSTIVLWVWTGYHLFLLTLGWPHSKRFLKLPFLLEGLRNPVDLPRISVLLPVKDEENVIEATLEGIVALQYPEHLLQIIVAEDGSKDRTREICESFAMNPSNFLFLHEDVSLGKSAALNRALKHATGEVLLFLDADTRFDRDLLLRAAKFFHDNPDADVAQALIDTYSDHLNLVAKLSRYEALAWFRGIVTAKDRLGLFVPLCGTGMFIKRKALEDAGEWNVRSLAEDIDMAVKVSARGPRIKVLPTRVWGQPAYTLRDFVNQRQRWWGGALQALPNGLGNWRNRKMRWLKRADMLVQLLAPLVFLTGTVYLLLAALFRSLGAPQPELVLATLLGVAASQIILVALILSYAIARRSVRDLELIPGIYLYWALELYSVLAVAVRLAFGKPPRWKVTLKRRISTVDRELLHSE